MHIVIDSPTKRNRPEDQVDSNSLVNNLEETHFSGLSFDNTLRTIPNVTFSTATPAGTGQSFFHLNPSFTYSMDLGSSFLLSNNSRNSCMNSSSTPFQVNASMIPDSHIQYVENENTFGKTTIYRSKNK